MNLARASQTLGLVAFAAFAGPLAAAEDAGWYGGVSAGQSRAKIDDARIVGGLIGGGFTAAVIADDDRDTGYKLFGGYRFNRNFALEGGYFDLGKFGFTASTVPLGTLAGNIKIKGANLDLVGSLPLGERFSAFARVGVARAEARDTFLGTGFVRVLNPNPRKSDTNAKFGLGLQYALTESLGLRAEVERFRINDAVGNKGDVDLATIGLIYRFGARRPAAMMPMTASAPVVPELRSPAPERIAAAPIAQPAVISPPPPRPVKVTFSADALFDFDKASVNPAGKQSLDKFANDLRAASYDVITVTGHTDRLGSEKYNMALSSARANAVKDYLVAPAGIASGKIAAIGAGESSPLTKPGDCKGSKATKALIACLQPDRRVDVEVTGTK